MLQVTPPSISAVESDDSVSLNCEVYGYAAFLNPQMWTDNDGARITANDKYGLSLTSGSDTLVYANGTRRPSILSTLTIRSVSLQDEGNYRCSVDTVSEEILMSSVLLTVAEAPSISVIATSVSSPTFTTTEMLTAAETTVTVIPIPPSLEG